MARNTSLNISPGGGGGAKGGGGSMGGSPQFSPDVKVGPKGSFGPLTPKTPARPGSGWDAESTPAQRWNPVVQSSKQKAYVNARWADQTPLRGGKVTSTDGWDTPKSVARFDNTGASVRINPVTANSPKQTAYVNARWAPGADNPLRGEVNSRDGWDTIKSVIRGSDK